MTDESLECERNLLIHSIQKAFASLSLRNKESIYYESGRFELEDFIAHYEEFYDDWAKVSPEILLNNTIDLCFFKPEVYPFFLAAYLRKH